MFHYAFTALTSVANNTLGALLTVDGAMVSTFNIANVAWFLFRNFTEKHSLLQTYQKKVLSTESYVNKYMLDYTHEVKLFMDDPLVEYYKDIDFILDQPNTVRKYVKNMQDILNNEELKIAERKLAFKEYFDTVKHNLRKLPDGMQPRELFKLRREYKETYTKGEEEKIKSFNEEYIKKLKEVLQNYSKHVGLEEYTAEELRSENLLNKQKQRKNWEREHNEAKEETKAKVYKQKADALKKYLNSLDTQGFPHTALPRLLRIASFAGSDKEFIDHARELLEDAKNLGFLPEPDDLKEHLRELKGIVDATAPTPTQKMQNLKKYLEETNKIDDLPIPETSKTKLQKILFFASNENLKEVEKNFKEAKKLITRYEKEAELAKTERIKANKKKFDELWKEQDVTPDLSRFATDPLKKHFDELKEILKRYGADIAKKNWLNSELQYWEIETLPITDSSKRKLIQIRDFEGSNQEYLENANKIIEEHYKEFNALKNNKELWQELKHTNTLELTPEEPLMVHMKEVMTRLNKNWYNSAKKEDVYKYLNEEITIDELPISIEDKKKLKDISDFEGTDAEFVKNAKEIAENYMKPKLSQLWSDVKYTDNESLIPYVKEIEKLMKSTEDNNQKIQKVTKYLKEIKIDELPLRKAAKDRLKGLLNKTGDDFVTHADELVKDVMTPMHKKLFITTPFEMEFQGLRHKLQTIHNLYNIEYDIQDINAQLNTIENKAKDRDNYINEERGVKIGYSKQLERSILHKINLLRQKVNDFEKNATLEKIKLKSEEQIEEFVTELKELPAEIERAIGNSCVGHARNQWLIEESRNKMMIETRKRKVIAAVRAHHWVDDIVHCFELPGSIISAVQLYCANYNAFLKSLTNVVVVNLPIVGPTNLLMFALNKFIFMKGIDFATETLLGEKGMGMMPLGMKVLGQVLQSVKYLGYKGVKKSGLYDVGKMIGMGSVASLLGMGEIFEDKNAPDAPKWPLTSKETMVFAGHLAFNLLLPKIVPLGPVLSTLVSSEYASQTACILAIAAPLTVWAARNIQSPLTIAENFTRGSLCAIFESKFIAIGLIGFSVYSGTILIIAPAALIGIAGILYPEEVSDKVADLIFSCFKSAEMDEEKIDKAGATDVVREL